MRNVLYDGALGESFLIFGSRPVHRKVEAMKGETEHVGDRDDPARMRSPLG
jgi:hypothetical protein